MTQQIREAQTVSSQEAGESNALQKTQQNRR